MLIYLAALAQNKALHPAGILYMPAFIASVTSDGTESADKLKQEVEKNLRMNGLLLKDNEILNAMEMGLNGRFIPVYLTKTRKLSGTASALNEPELQIVLALRGASHRNNGGRAFCRRDHGKTADAEHQRLRVVPSIRPSAGSEHAADDAEKNSMKNDEALARMENDLEKGSGENAELD